MSFWYRTRDAAQPLLSILMLKNLKTGSHF